MTSNAEWGPGPWDDEPDQLLWKDQRTGLQCQAMRNPHMGFFCGYVGVPPGHTLFGWDYDDDIRIDPKLLQNNTIDGVSIISLFFYSKKEYDNNTAPVDLVLQVHGGVTYSAEEDGLWWFGFDCGHAFDLSPWLRMFWRRKHAFGLEHTEPLETYRDINFVKQQCADLAFQLKQLEAAKELTTATEWLKPDQ